MQYTVLYIPNSFKCTLKECSAGDLQAKAVHHLQRETILSAFGQILLVALQILPKIYSIASA